MEWIEDKPIRIAHVIGKVVSGGVESVVMNYYRHIDPSKVQFDFIMDGEDETYLDEEIKALGGRVYKVEPYDRSILKHMKQCYKIFRENQYAVVHSHLNTLSVFPLCAAWLAGVRLRIAHNHSTVAKGEGKRAFLKYMLRPLAKVFANSYATCSEYAGRWLFGNRCYDKGKVKLFQNAIDISKYSYSQDVRQRVRRQLGLDNNFVVGHVGRFAYQKNHTFLIDIFKEVYAKNPRSVLLLIGSGDLEPEIKNKVNQLGLTDCVVFLGVRQDVPDLLQAMDAFVFPSNFEGLGLVAIEAQAAGLKILVSTEVPEEARITKLLDYSTLAETAEEWAQKVLACHADKREKTDKEILESGFEIRQAANNLELWYESLLKRYDFLQGGHNKRTKLDDEFYGEGVGAR